jgi:hypothetical protein
VTEATRDAVTEDLGPVVDRLTVRYPHLPRQEITAVVTRHHEAFADAKIRSFVPVLVGRRAAAELSNAHATT